MMIRERAPRSQWVRQFPKTIYTCGEVAEQLKKIEEELEEFKAEVKKGIEKKDRGTIACIELWDVIHACETMLDIFEAQGIDVDHAKDLTFEKNSVRGYYAPVRKPKVLL